MIAYDENGNRPVDPAEGVAGISVRVVETNTNRVIASGFTDARGYVEFEIVTDAPAQIVVPYFGRDVGASAAETLTLHLHPAAHAGQSTGADPLEVLLNEKRSCSFRCLC